MKHSNHQMSGVNLLIMAALSFIAMYILMYAMVDTFANVYANVNQFYMAGLMTAAMMLIELALMRSMYSKKIIWGTAAASVAALGLFFVFIRMQLGVSDKEFLRSMISHHGAALLMCEQADIKDPEIEELCQAILSSQQEQIDWMRAKLAASDFQ
jgi:uncharacterized protein (DUF305 family)